MAKRVLYVLGIPCLVRGLEMGNEVVVRRIGSGTRLILESVEGSVLEATYQHVAPVRTGGIKRISNTGKPLESLFVGSKAKYNQFWNESENLISSTWTTTYWK